MGDDAPQMSSQRPYLLRALYEWVVDNGMTPHVLVDATQPGVRVPAHAVKDGRIVLNIAERAVAHLQMDNDDVRFSARFGGVSHAVIVPIDAVLAIYARENGQGMALPEDVVTPASAADVQAVEPISESVGDPPPEDEPPGGEPPPKRGAHLRVVK